MPPHELRPAWRKSSRSGEQGQCVELADLGDVIGIRDSKAPAGPVLTISRRVLAVLAAEMKADRFG